MTALGLHIRYARPTGERLRLPDLRDWLAKMNVWPSALTRRRSLGSGMPSKIAAAAGIIPVFYRKFNTFRKPSRIINRSSGSIPAADFRIWALVNGF